MILLLHDGRIRMRAVLVVLIGVPIAALLEQSNSRRHIRDS